MAARRTGRSAPRPVPSAHPGWRQAWEAWAGDLALRGRSPRTLRTYAGAVRRFTRYLGPQCGPTELTPAHVLGYFGHRIHRASPATLALERTAVRLFLAYLGDQGMVAEAAAKAAERLPDRRRPVRQPVFLTAEEALRFLRVVATSERGRRAPWQVLRDRLLFRLLLTTGMRISEALSLTVDAAVQALSDGTFRVIGKGDKERLIPVEDGLEPLVRAYLKVRPGREAALFIGRRGRPLGPRSVQFLTRRLAREAGIVGKHVTPHKLRHTFATALLRETGNLRLVQELLGHQSLQTTQIYTHVLAGEQRDAVNRLPYARRPS